MIFGKIGHCYEIGIGPEQSLEKAIYYYKLAGEHGFTEGYNQAGNCLLSSKWTMKKILSKPTFVLRKQP